MINILANKQVNVMESIKYELYKTLIVEDRWKLFLQGLGITIEITLFSLIVGIVIGTLIAMVRTSYDKHYKEVYNPFFKIALYFFNLVCKIYLTIVRGTPSVVQIMIWFYIILQSSNNKIFVACVAFGTNSGAYVAEIIRSGIMSVDEGQMEAGRSLGMNYVQTMRLIVIPQAIRNVLPALVNELIVLLKETAIAGYVALQDLTKVSDIVRSRTYSSTGPLLVTAVIYLLIVIFLELLLGKLERRLRKNER